MSDMWQWGLGNVCCLASAVWLVLVLAVLTVMRLSSEWSREEEKRYDGIDHRPGQ